MKESARARRLKRHLRRNQHQGKLNLVSLMDIFTILVFFLMVNSSSEVQVLSQNDTIRLPDSTAEQHPDDVLALTVTDQDILVNGRPVIRRDDFLAYDGMIEPSLKEELKYQASRASGPVPENGRPITILADRELPYEFLRKVMSTCVEAGYSAISLAVNQKAEQGA